MLLAEPLPNAAAHDPRRSRCAPTRRSPNPHQRTSTHRSPRALELPGVHRADSLVSVPARSPWSSTTPEAWPPEAFQAGRELAHLDPPEDGSLHMTLRPDLAAEAYATGWGEPHPVSATPLIYAPRDADELEVVLGLLRASYEYATGTGRD
jgi:Family of unknown function (DUF5519)